MDVNLTHAIAANVTLDQSLWIPLISFSSGIIGALVGGAATYIIQRSNIKSNQFEKRKQRQEQVYSRLMGLEIMTDQLQTSMNEAYTLFALIRARERLHLPSRPELGKLEEKHRECNELAHELARNYQRLWETIGLIRVLFSPSEELEKLIKPFKPSMVKLREHRESIVSYYNDATISNVEIEPYAVSNKGAEEVIIKYVVDPFEALQKYLIDEIRAENDLH